MTRCACVIALTLFATCLYAQDDGDGGGGGGNDDFISNSDDFPAGPAVPERDVLGDVRNWLQKTSAPPMDSKQQKALKKIYDKEVKAMAKTFEKRFGESLESVLAAQTPTRGRRGQSASRTKPEHAAAICRMSAQLVDKVIAGLRVDQQAVLRRYQSEELRMTKTTMLTRNLELAGVPLTAEQKEETDALFKRESRLRTLMIIESKGEPYQTKTTPLEAQTTQRVSRLLGQDQLKVLLQTVASTRPRDGNCSGT
jgi:hypothetical protein